MKRSSIHAAAALLFLSAALAFGQVQNPTATSGQGMPGSEKQDAQQRSDPGEKRYVASIGANGVQEVGIIGGEYYFDPNYIVVKVNIPVELTVLKAKSIVSHDILVRAPDAGIDFKIKMSDKEPKKVSFTPTKVGKYEIYCDEKFLFFKSHKDKGMKGTIEVVP